MAKLKMAYLSSLKKPRKNAVVLLAGVVLGVVLGRPGLLIFAPGAALLMILKLIRHLPSRLSWQN